MNINPKIGLKIKTARESRGWTQARLSEESGISLSHIGMIESGRSAPSVKAIEKIGRALNVDSAYFLETEKGVFFDEYRDHLSLEEKAFISQQKNRPWITLSKDLENTGLTPEQVRSAIKMVMQLTDKFKKENP